MAEYDPSASFALDVDSMEGDQHDDYDTRHDLGDNEEEEGDDDDDDYDPSAFGFNSSSAHHATEDVAEGMPSDGARQTQPIPPTAQQPRTIGGFIVEDDDEEEEDQEDSMVATPQSNSMTAQDVSLASAPTTDPVASVHPSSSTSLTRPTAVTTATTAASFAAAAVPDLENAAYRSTSVTNSTSDRGKMGTPSIATPTPQSNGIVVPPNAPVLESARLPHDRVGRLEDRIKDDPKAATDAWRELLEYYKEKDQQDNICKTYERFLEVFPTSAFIWIEYIQYVLDHMDRNSIDSLLSRSLEHVQSLNLWNTYLDYLRRILPLSNDPTGQNRSTITQAFEAVLDNVGIDPEAGDLWNEYIDFVSSGPGSIGGTGWQDAQKMDLLRKAYQRAVKVPHSALTHLWKEYDKFEMGLNKANARKALQEQSPHYMTARSASMQLAQWIHGLDRRTLPILPPIHGCEGEDAFGDQVEKWRGWIDWEKTDPLVFKEDDLAAYNKRVLYAYKQAAMYLRFYPQIWYDAAQWCFDQGTEELVTQGDKFLDDGIAANPESVLLALKRADRVEVTLDAGSTDAIAIANGERLDVPYENVLKALYTLREKMLRREKQVIAQVKEHFANLSPDEESAAAVNDDYNDYEDATTNKGAHNREEQAQAQVQAITTASRGQLDVLRSTISYIWIAKMRAFRRIQGQGMPKKPKKGFRGVFAEARPRGQLSSDVYVASALMEWHCYKDHSALKIFERGLRLFPTDEIFAQEYIKHLIDVNDLTNARVVFETTITKILAPAPANVTNATAATSSPVAELQKRQRVRPLFGYMHNFESNYGDLAQIQKLEKRMADLYPTESSLGRFADRFVSMPPVNFDAIDVQLIISPTQARPKLSGAVDLAPLTPAAPFPSIEDGVNGNNQLGAGGSFLASPKRPLEDSDTDSPQRKFLRAESPLKGAAGRRMQLNAAAALASNPLAGGVGFAVKNYVPPGSSALSNEVSTFDNGVQLLPKPIYELLRKLPHARDYNAVIFDPIRTVEFLRAYDLQAARTRAGR